MASDSSTPSANAATPYRYIYPKVPFADRTLQIDLRADYQEPLDRTLIPAYGTCPLDDPFWLGHTEGDFDRRLLPPHSLRYICARESRPHPKDQHTITQHVWMQVHQLQEADGKASKIPSVLFNYEPLAEHGAAVDLVFESSEAALRIAGRLEHIKLNKDGKSICTFSYSGWSNSLDGSIFPIDCLRLPLDPSNGEAIMRSLDHAVGQLGSVIGIGRVQITTEVPTLFNPDEGITRAYVKLARASMKLPFSALVAPLPSHFVWQGIPYKLRFAGSQRREEALFSADYPLEEEQGNAQSHTHESSASDPTVASASASTASIEIKEENGIRKRSRQE